ncbi:MAG: hypothetical protein M1528_00005 [Candidatus Marsarchaeota archaeon]|nr:hypothetical protein [Candidatus Marsarchaeota archaeon]
MNERYIGRMDAKSPSPKIFNERAMLNIVSTSANPNCSQYWFEKRILKADLRYIISSVSTHGPDQKIIAATALISIIPSSRRRPILSILGLPMPTSSSL